MNTAQAQALGVDGQATVRVEQAAAAAELELVIDERIPKGCVYIPLAVPGAEALAAGFGPVTVGPVR